jgi:multiple sugar transport system permease protein
MLRRAEGWLLLAPLAGFLLLWLGFPFLTDIVYSLSRVRFETLRSPQLQGFGNYIETLADPGFWHAMRFSLRYALLSAALQVGLGLLLALALEPILSRHASLMALLLLPLMISPALMGVMYRLLLNEFVGPIPAYLALIGLEPDLLGADWVFTTVVAIDVLQWTPFTLLLLLTALQAIPQEVMEAARVDGASPWQNLRCITLPLLVPALAICGFVRFIDSFRVFDHIYVLTGGGPGDATTGISLYIYRAFFQQQRIGPAVASSMILLLLSLLLLGLAMGRTLRGARA